MVAHPATPNQPQHGDPKLRQNPQSLSMFLGLLLLLFVVYLTLTDPVRAAYRFSCLVVCCLIVPESEIPYKAMAVQRVMYDALLTFSLPKSSFIGKNEKMPQDIILKAIGRGSLLSIVLPSIVHGLKS